jgi:adenylate kinase
MRLMIIGPQGVGKGTQSALLCQALGVPHISTGDLFRNHAAERTELGRRAQQYMDAGELVPDDVTNAMVADRLAAADTATGFLLDGFPRTREQGRWLGELLGPDRPLQAVIVLEAPEPELVQRLLLRGRPDDLPEIIHRRLELYRSTTQPLLDHYADLLIPIDGTGEIAAVQARILQALGTDRDRAHLGPPPDGRDSGGSTSVPGAGRFEQLTETPGSGIRATFPTPPDGATHREAPPAAAVPTVWPRHGWTDRR